MQRNVDTWERVVSLAAGAALIGLAARSRRWRSIAASSGAGTHRAWTHRLLSGEPCDSDEGGRSMTRAMRSLVRAA
jgi:hypothetical protein